MINLETFQDEEFSTAQLIESTSARIVKDIGGSGDNSPIFDPKPFIRSFESLQEEIGKIKRKLQKKIEDSEDQILASVGSRNKSFREFNELFDETNQSFERLNLRLGKVGNTAIRIGEQLETIDRHRKRACEAKDLIQYFLEFNSGSFARIKALRDEGPNGEFQTAIILRRLNTITQEMDLPGITIAKENVEKFCEEFERTLLQNFDQVLSQGDRQTMNHIARTLIAFNGGSSCVQTYVNQHAFFINLAKMAESEVEPVEGETPDQQRMQALYRFYEDILQAVSNEWDVIHFVFPNASTVIQVFVQRIFAQSVQNFLENLVLEAQNISTEVYLNVLADSHYETSVLVAELHKFDEGFIAPFAGSPVLTNILDRSFEDLYVQFLDGGKYGETEKEWVIFQIDEALKPYFAYQDSIDPKDKTKRRTSLRKDNNTQSMVTNLMGIITTESKTELPAVEELSIVTAMGCIQASHEAIERAKELCRPTELPGFLMSIMEILLTKVGNQYLEHAINTLSDELSEAKSPHAENKNTAQAHSLKLIKVANEILLLLQMHIQSFEIHILVNSTVMHRNLISMKNELIVNVEKKLNSIVQKRIHSKVILINDILTLISNILGKQKKSDYNLKEGMLGSTICTQTCEQIAAILKSVVIEASNNFEDTNRNSFLTQIGTSFCRTILEHIKKYNFSYTGGMILSADLSKYHEAILQFKIEHLNEYFGLLKEICNLYIVKPENLKIVLQDGYLSRLDRPILHAYLSLRMDWGKLSRMEKDLFQRK